MSNLLTTQLYNFHVDQKSKLIEFAGWDMPFSYDGTLKEHNYVRNNCGFFDVSHMGRLVLDIDQIQNVSKLICSDILNLDNSKALYSIFTNKYDYLSICIIICSFWYFLLQCYAYIPFICFLIEYIDSLFTCRVFRIKFYKCAPFFYFNVISRFITICL